MNGSVNKFAELIHIYYKTADDHTLSLLLHKVWRYILTNERIVYSYQINLSRKVIILFGRHGHTFTPNKDFDASKWLANYIVKNNITSIYKTLNW